MVQGKKCESCHDGVTGKRATYTQTRFCEACAKKRKRANTLSPWTPEQKRAYMRTYMRAYRKAHPGLSSQYVRSHREKERAGPEQGSATYLSSFAWFMPMLVIVMLSSGAAELNFETLKELLTSVEVLTVHVTGLVVVGVICWRHLESFFKDKK